MTQIICFLDIFWPRKPSRKNFLAKINEMRSNSVLTCDLKGFKYSKLQLIFGKLHCKNDFQFPQFMIFSSFQKDDDCTFYVKSWFQFHLLICNSFTKFFNQKFLWIERNHAKKQSFVKSILRSSSGVFILTSFLTLYKILHVQME